MTIILDSDELAGVTSYRTPKRQLAELHRQSSAAARPFFAAMYSSNSLRTHFGPPSSSHASRWAWVSGRQDTGAGRGGAGGRPAPSRLPPLMLLETESCGHTVHGTAQRTQAPS